MKSTKIIITSFLIFLEACSAAPSKNRNTHATENVRDLKVTRYKDPDGAFTIDLPEGWKVERQINDEPWITLISSTKEAWSTIISSDSYRAARLIIFAIQQGSMKGVPADLKENYLMALAKPFFDGWLAGLKEQTKVEKASKVYRTRVDGVEALRMGITYYRGDEYDPRTGYGAVVLGSHTGFYIMLTGSDAGVKALEEIISTLKIEPGK